MSAPNGVLPAYALLIAINGHGLVAPESDAVRLQHTLMKLGVPTNSIEILAGPTATRNNIIRQLHSIRTHPRIVRDAPILIYFAGHGSQQMINVPSLGDRKAECIFPFDALTKQAYPIPDITISALLGEIARSKSNHITLLLDCCHSGSGSRDNPASLPEDLPEFDKDLFEKEDGELWSQLLKDTDPPNTDDSSRAASANPCSFRYQGITSHVLIAACRENERSFEYPAHPGRPPVGLFTESLIRALDECRQDKMLWNLTYSGLFSRIKDIMQDLGRNQYRQTPQCEGYHRDRYVFATPAFPHRNRAIAPVEEYDQPGHPQGLYVLPVGSLAGVHQNATFEIYDYPGGRRRLIGRFQVSSITESRTIFNAKRDLGLGPDAYAVLCTPPVTLPVEVAPDFLPTWNDQRFQANLVACLGSHYPLNHFITPVQPGHHPKLRISGSLRHGVRLQTSFGSVINIPNPSTSQVAEALARAVMFYHHLSQSSSSSEPFELQVVELTMTAVRGLSPEDQSYVGALVPRPDRKPITLHPDEETRVNAPHDPSTPFGIRVRNRGAYNYFVYVFYFDPNDFSITSIYMPPSSDGTVVSLPTRGELTIGYGDGGAAPLQFAIDDHLEKDLGFFKVYFSLSPSEMSTIQQNGIDPNQRGDSRPGGSHYNHSSPPYGSIQYPLAVLNPHRSRH